MKIIVIGAGIGGLQAAKLLSEGGADVTVYEACDRKALSYDWIDDVEPTVFEDIQFPLPPHHFRTDNTSFAVPMSDKVLRVKVPDEKREWSIERREFSEMMVSRAENAGAKLIFGTKVNGLIIDTTAITGIIIDGKKVDADLVIDCSGATSPFRASLPDKMGITAHMKDNEVFRVFRAFYTSSDGIEKPIDTKKIYLKHLGEDGISWCFVEPNGEANVLIGRMGGLSENSLNTALTELKKSNPIIGDEIIRGGGIYTIPVRYFLPRMVANGYAAIGDAAFMTVPMIGSGISNSLRAGKILAETILTETATDVASLWKYEYRYVKEVGASQVMVDSMKRMLLSAPADDVRFLFESGIIGDAEMDSIGSGEKLTLSPAQILDKLKRGWKRLGLLLKLVGAINRGEKAEKCAFQIPAVFDEDTVSAWQKKLDSYFK